MTQRRWPASPPEDRAPAVLFGAQGDGSIVCARLRVLRCVLLQFSPKGSYRYDRAEECYEWVLEGRVP
eukprot:1773761-Alexandrium_andersonii.AAC.1